ncbi:hypothetical protein WAB17_04880 [Parerythrobacter aurantius]|uniref:hypothetical protein n=1 Tax=Parerythrobacter aurantius TaxID=3127706 RepID=UPI003255449D
MKPAAVLLLAAAAALQGCAAAVIPVAAGALMATGKAGGNTEARDQSIDLQRVDVAAPEAAQRNSSDAVPVPSPVPVDALPETGTRAILLPGVTELPAPSPQAPAGIDTTYRAFADYALGIAGRDPLADPVRPSALLAAPGSLVPRTAPCRFAASAVLIDLDPQQGDFDPALPVSRPGLADALARLRSAGVDIVWSTALTADRAGDVRRWLRENGLDPAGGDRLLLMRYAEDRKQTRRAEASGEHCLVAMLGDERADFDELFDYLRNPDAALPLDALLGRGWFLAPVSSAVSRNPAATPDNDEGPLP